LKFPIKENQKDSKKSQRKKERKFEKSVEEKGGINLKRLTLILKP